MVMPIMEFQFYISTISTSNSIKSTTIIIISILH